ncbi:unnamed protein product [Discula destructiva]
MVLLTMTPSIVEAIHKRKDDAPRERQTQDGDTTLEEPAVGKPISHAQIISLWEDLEEHDGVKYSLESLLRGAAVYIPPPPPKPEKSAEYKALMARLRYEAEERTYQRMATHQAPTFAQQYPTSSLAHSFADIHRPSNKADEGDGEDSVMLDEAHRQVMLVLNFLLTILGCAATLWVLARWWSTPARLFLTLGGSVIVGVAEVGVYQAYLWHLSEAKKRERRMKETKEVVETFVVGREHKSDEENMGVVDAKQDGDGDGVRLRKRLRREET